MAESIDPAIAVQAYLEVAKLRADDVQLLLYAAGGLASLGSYEKAETTFKRVIEIDPNNIDARLFLGQTYQDTEKHDAAIEQYRTALELDTNNLRATTKLIQLYQAADNKELRDTTIEQLYNTRKLGNNPELNATNFYIRDQFNTDQFRVFVLEYFELIGDRAVKIRFRIHDLETNQPANIISLGSYEPTTAIARELGSIGPDDRRFHLDGYPPDGSHQTFGFYTNQPDYDLVKAQVIEILNQTIKPVSSTQIVRPQPTPQPVESP